MFAYNNMILVVSLFFGLTFGQECSDMISIDSTWQDGTTGTMHVKFPETVSSWHMNVIFSNPIWDFKIWEGQNMHCITYGNDYTECDFNNLDYNGNIDAGYVLDLPYFYHFHAPSEIVVIAVNGITVCDASSTTTTIATTTSIAQRPAHHVLSSQQNTRTSNAINLSSTNNSTNT